MPPTSNGNVVGVTEEEGEEDPDTVVDAGHDPFLAVIVISTVQTTLGRLTSGRPASGPSKNLRGREAPLP